ncbi:MAG: imidazole glycerol phosphate synthase subunit HisH [Kiritimatiellae bacterium]|nr:imidazole glycerol phosphate synthase subunit HisH [Kiritimatiellia bacterium]
MGNLGSVYNACKFLGIPAELIVRAGELERCAAVILPGVGAFGDCRAHLDAHGFAEPLTRWIRSGRPLLGICLGMQLLFESSEESPGVPGLGIFPGRVRRFPDAPGLKVPQMGWNRVRQRNRECPIFRGVPDQAYFYFVHSFYCDPADARVTAGDTEYGRSYSSVVWQGRVAGVQFHPEKSQDVGLAMLRAFADWSLNGIAPSGAPA